MSVKSLRDHEGYLLLDHSNSPGVPDEVSVSVGLPVGSGMGLFEAPTFTCHHCQSVGVIDPKRSNGMAYYCKGCSHLICDPCGEEKVKTGVCRTFEQRVDEFLTSLEKNRSI